MQAGLWTGAGFAVGIALASGWLDWRRRHRDDLDAVGIVDWPTVQMFSLITALVLASLALRR